MYDFHGDGGLFNASQTHIFFCLNEWMNEAPKDEIEIVATSVHISWAAKIQTMCENKN